MASASDPLPTVRTAREFLEAIRRSGVISEQQLEKVRDRVRVGRYPGEVPDLARRLIRNGTLTIYQARHLLHGQGEDLAIGRYVILDLIGRGAMGKVYKARHRLMGRVDALKLVSPEYLARPSALPRFLREMQLVGRLEHPNIVRAYDADQAGRVPYIAMEYVPGRDLERLLSERGPLAPAEVARLAIDAASGLAHAHGRGIVHRDVKPSNLLLGEDGRVRVLDLGLGILMGAGDDDRGTFATRDGITLGTPDYMSPEQATGRPGLDGRSDQFGLGCVMYHLLTGRIPFPGDSQVERLASRIKGSPAPLEGLRPGLPPGLVAVVERLMANRADDRYPTADEAAGALRAFCGEGWPLGCDDVARPLVPAASATGGEPTPPPTSPVPASEAPRRLLRPLVAMREMSPRSALVTGLAALLTAFAAGFGLACAIH